MKKFLPILVLIGIVLAFFYKTLIFGKIPFPGDLLLAGYSPWRHESYGGYVAGGLPSKDQYFDVIRELYPWKTLVLEQLKHGKMPLWNPYNFSGAPLLANYQSQVFYPPAFLYLILPQVAAWTVLVILQPILGSIFLYLFTVEIGLSPPAAILTAILFNFSSFANVWMEFNTVWHTILWLPLLLYLVERGIKQKRLLFWQQICFIVGLFSAITAGHPQYFLNCFFFLTVYTLIRLFTEKNMSGKEKMSFLLFPILFVVVTPFCLAAPQLFPTIDLFRNSARVSHEYQQIINQMLVQWWQLPLVVVQEFFGNPATKSNITGDYVGKTLSVGVAGFFLVVAALNNTRKSWHKKFFIGTALFILLITVNTPITQLFYRYPMPVLSTGGPTRILFLLMLSLSVLAGFGYNEVVKSKKFSVRPTLVVIVAILICGILILSHRIPPNMQDIQTAMITMKRALILTACFGITAIVIAFLSQKKKAFMLLFIPLCAFELFYGFLKFNPFVQKLFVFPQNNVMTYLQTHTGINRFWGYGTAAIEANFATQEQIFSPDGTDPLNLRWYNQFLQSSHNGVLPASFDRTTRSDALLSPGYGALDLPRDEFRLRVLDVLGVKYILSRTENPTSGETFPESRFREVWRENDWIVYENLKSSPRYFLTGDVRSYKDNADFEKKFFAKDFEPGKTALLQSNDMQTLPKLSEGTGSATLVSYDPTHIRIDVETDAPQFLFLSDTYDSGWRASVNKKETKVYRTNYAFRGIIVPKGKSTVEFTYQPTSFRVGWYLSITTLSFLLAYGGWTLIWKRHT